MTEIALDEFARLAAVCRLDETTAQRVFRALMESSARPGTLVPAPTLPGVPSAVVPLLALCDLETSIAVCGGDGLDVDWASLVTAVTGARRRAPDVATWIAVLDPDGLADALRSPTGSAESPESAARLIVAVDRLRNVNGHPAWSTSSDADTATVAVSGPGVDGVRVLRIEGIDPEFLARVDRENRFPAGRDVWLADREGRLVGLPRSCRTSPSPNGMH